jgi:excisionase family DNA binding protein
MTSAEAAEYLSVPRDSLTRLEKRGLPVHRMGTGPKAPKRYFAAELDTWLKSKCNAQTPDHEQSA